MAALRKPPPVRMTLEEFFARCPGDPSVRSWQLIDGEPVAMAVIADGRSLAVASGGAASVARLP